MTGTFDLKTVRRRKGTYGVVGKDFPSLSLHQSRPYLPSLIEKETTSNEEEMDRRKRISMGGPVTSTPSAMTDHVSRLRSARHRGQRTPHTAQSSVDLSTISKRHSEIFSSRESNKRRSPSNDLLSHGIRDLSHDATPIKIQNGNEKDFSSSLTQSLRREFSSADTFSAKNIKKEEEEDTNSRLEDIEDSIESSLVLNPSTKHLQRPQGSPITLETARSLRSFLFQSSSHGFSSGWFNQGFEFNPPGSSLSYGLRQRKGGPCGIIAVVQGYVIKHLLFESSKHPNPLSLDSVQDQRNALLEALVAIFDKISESGEITLLRAGNRTHFSGIGNYYKSDGVTERLEIHSVPKASLRKSLAVHLDGFFEADCGVICFLYSVLLSKGLERIKSEMDVEDSSFIGAHGYCTQEMVNLLLTGFAVSNTFDGSMTLSDGDLTLKGIESVSEIGLLSLFEHYGSISVGRNLKDPVFPIWIICSESHFSVLFSASKTVRNELIYYDELSKQEGPIRLRLLRDEETMMSASPIEKCVRTKWSGIGIEWMGSEPLL